MNLLKNTTHNSTKRKSNAIVNGEEGKRLSSSAKVFKNDVDRLIYPNEIQSTRPKSVTLHGLSRKKPLPGLNGTKPGKTPLDVWDYRQISHEESQDDSFNDVFSPVLSSAQEVQRKPEQKTFHDAHTLKILKTEFSAPSRSTYGLSRSASPENPNCQKRYWTLVNSAIESNVVTPLSSVWIENTHRFVPVELRDRFANILEGITNVSNLADNIFFPTPFYSCNNQSATSSTGFSMLAGRRERVGRGYG